MNTHVLIPRSVIICFFLIGLTTALEAKEYGSLAKLIVGGADAEAKLEDGRPLPKDFYVTQIEVLESASLLRKAQAKLKGLTHESPIEQWRSFRWDGPEVKVQAKRQPDSRIINILVTCNAQEIPQDLLNCLIDEYLIFRRVMREQAYGHKLRIMLDKLVSTLKTKEDLELEIKKAGVGASEKLKKQFSEVSETYSKTFKEAEKLQQFIESNPEIIQIMERASQASDLSR